MSLRGRPRGRVGAPGQQGPGRGDRRVLLGERALAAQGFGATPRAGAPHNHDRRVAEGNIVQDPGTAAVRPRENAAVGTESLVWGGFHLHGDRVGDVLDGGHVQTRQVDQGITTRAVSSSRVRGVPSAAGVKSTMPVSIFGPRGLVRSAGISRLVPWVTHGDASSQSEWAHVGGGPTRSVRWGELLQFGLGHLVEDLVPAGGFAGCEGFSE